MAFSVLTPFGVGSRLTGLAANRIITAIQQLQAMGTGIRFLQTKTGITQTASADLAVGSWSTMNGYTLSGSGVTVPNDGQYMVTFRAAKTSGSWNTRAYLSCTVGSAVYRSSIDAGVGEDNACVSFMTDSIAAGTLITPRYYTGVSATSTFTLSIVQLIGT